MLSDRELLERVMQRLKRAVERGTGTSLSDEEVRIIGSLLYAVGSSVLPGPNAREACAMCGRPPHDPASIGGFPRHTYEPGLLVPLLSEATP